MDWQPIGLKIINPLKGSRLVWSKSIPILLERKKKYLHSSWPRVKLFEMLHSHSTNAARQCLRLSSSKAPSRTRGSFSSKSLHLSLFTTSNSKPYACRYSSHYSLNCRPSPSNRSFSAPRPAARSRSCFRAKVLYSTSPSTIPESLSTEQYHELADSYIDSLLVHLEQLQEERADVDCEYSVRFPTQTLRSLNYQRLTSPVLTGRRSNPRLPATRHLRAE